MNQRHSAQRTDGHGLTRRLWLGLCLALFLAQAHAKSEAETEPVVVPSEMCRGYFLVPITLADREGYPEDRTLWFLYDTGASNTLVDPDSLERASGKSMARVSRVSLKDVTAGDVTWNTLPARVNKLAHLSKALGRQIDGILGYRAFDKYLLTLDYARGEMRLTEGSLPRPDGRTVFDTDGKDSRPWMDVTFASRTRRMLIDSGAAMTSLAVNRLERFDTQAPPVATGAAVRLKKVERRRGARAAEDAMFGPFRLVTPTLEETPGSELIGGEVMEHFTWTFDVPNERVRIEPNDADNPITFEPLTGHGMVLVPGDDGLAVHAVLESKARDSGVQAGDVITHIDHRPLLERGCEKNPDGAMHVRVMRGKASLEFTVERTQFVP